MPPILHYLEGDDVPEFLTIGHVTRDLHPDGSFSLGGTVTFAALTAYRLGLVAAIVSRADAELLAELPARLAGICLAARPSAANTAVVHLYHQGFCTQDFRGKSGLLLLEGKPASCDQS